MTFDIKHVIAGALGIALGLALNFLAGKGIAVQCPSPAPAPAAVVSK